MGDGVTVSVVVPPQPGSVPTPAPSVPGHVPPAGAPEGPLPFTGFDAGLWLVLAIVLVLIGVVVVRRNSPSKEVSMKSRSKFSAPLTLALTLVLTAGSALAFAQSTPTVTTEVGESSRNLTVTDLAGVTLTDLALTPGQPRAFKVTVVDENVAATDGFNVQSTLNNLYLQDGQGGYTFSESIPSNKVDVSYATSPLSTLGNAVDLNPDYLLSATDLGCDDIASSLGVSVASLALDPVCLLLGGITGGLSFSDVPLDASAVTGVDLNSLLPSELPIGIAAGDTGDYTAADCTGIGAADISCTGTGTPLDYMVGTGLTGAVTGALDTLLRDALTSAPLSSVDGTSAVASAEAVIQALAGASNSAVSDLGNALSEYAPDDQVTVLNDLISFALSPIDELDLANVLGTYNAFPMLTVNTTGITTAGSYAGTLTITLIE